MSENTAAQQQAPQTGIVAKKAPPREPIPAGNYIARCYLMIHIGTVSEQFGKSSEPRKVNKLRIGWELPLETRVFKEGDEPKPCAISEEYTLSTSPKANLRKMIDSWRGKALTEKEAEAFDVTKLLGKACMINIIHVAGKGDNAGKVYEKIASIAPLAKGTMCPEPVNEVRYFNYNEKFDAAWVEKLPDFIKNKIKSSDEWAVKVTEGVVARQTSVEAEESSSPAASGAEGLQTVDDSDLPF